MPISRVIGFSAISGVTLQSLYIVRHGQTIWNTENRIQGRLDSSLTDLGRSQANDHGKRLADQGIELMLVSPLGRALETANLLNSHIQAEMREDDRLLERACGDWSGLTLTQIEKQFATGWRERKQDPYHHRPPGGENHNDMLERVSGLLESLFMMDEKCICLVTHGVMSRVILTYYLSLTPTQATTVKHPNGLYYRLQFSSEEILVHRFELGAAEQQGLLKTPSGGKIVGQDQFSNQDGEQGS